MRFTSAIVGLACLVALFSIAGCGAVEQAKKAANRQKDLNDLKMVGLMFHNHHDTHRKGPANWEELIAFADQQGSGPVVKSVKDRGYVMTAWDIQFKDITIGTSNFVLLYEPTATTSGGNVLLLDGSALTMTADELNAALAAQKSM